MAVTARTIRLLVLLAALSRSAAKLNHFCDLLSAFDIFAKPILSLATGFLGSLLILFLVLVLVVGLRPHVKVPEFVYHDLLSAYAIDGIAGSADVCVLVHLYQFTPA